MMEIGHMWKCRSGHAFWSYQKKEGRKLHCTYDMFTRVKLKYNQKKISEYFQKYNIFI